MGEKPQEEQPVILTCAQPTGQLTLGNYLGAVRNWSTMLDEFECYFGIVDMHAITVPYVPAELRRNVLECVAQYVACGLDPEKCHLFVQSHVTGHTELAWVLTCLTPIGELQRMTQFKEKIARLGFKVDEQQGEDSPTDDLKFTHSGARAQASVNAGLLCYPVLMASDILIYNADRVPVGEDQRQHLELCRDLAARFNNTYSETFKIPDAYVPKTGARIMSLADPTRKMSKSDDNDRATLYILDEPDRILKKIGSAVTDSGSEVKAGPDKPGVSNLLAIHAGLSGETVPALEEKFAGQGYGAFKAEIGEVVVEALRPVREKYHELIKDKDYLRTVLRNGAEAAQRRANKIMRKVYRKVGFPDRTQ